MISKLKEKKEWIVLTIMAVVIIFFGTYRISEVGQPIMNPDEIGYWANSSFFMGIDWSSATNNMYYYSYGYSFLLIPIRLLANFFMWDWRQKYEAMIVVQSFMLAGTFLIVVRLCKRYMSDFHWLVRDFASLLVVLYPSYIAYAHMTCTETTLFCLFWIYLYIMMRVIDHPTNVNHICFALVSFYVYIVHQRTLPIIIASSLTILAMRLLRANKLSQAYGFVITMFLCNIVHSAIKGKLKNDFYMAAEPAGRQEILGYIFSKVNLMLLFVVVFVILFMWLAEYQKGRFAIVLAVLVLSVGTVYIVRNFSAMEEAASNVSWHMSGNDFAGQLWRIRDIMTIQGFLRFLISIAGKWFYLATASGLIICYGIWHMGKHFIKTSVKGIMGISYIWTKSGYSGENKNMEMDVHKKNALWLWGAFLVWLGIFIISAFAISGIGRVDNLIYGRYHEFAAGILILYGFYSLDNDKKWVRHLIFFVALYLLAAWLCQYLFDELEISTFEEMHCFMMGLFIHDGEVPNGRIWYTTAYVVPIGVIICTVIKAVQGKLPKVSKWCMLAALISAISIYMYMGRALVQNYVIGLNIVYEERIPIIAVWIDRLWRGEDIYFMDNGEYYMWGLELQYYLDDKAVIIRDKNDIPDTENAFLVVLTADIESNEFFGQCENLINGKGFSLLVPSNSEIYRRMEDYYK